MTQDKKSELKKQINHYGSSILVMCVGLSKAIESYHRDANFNVMAIVLGLVGGAGTVFFRRKVLGLVEQI